MNTDNRISNEKTTFVHVDPSTLLVDRNVRRDAQLDREFLADLGGPMPIVAVRTANGELRVRYGHRRALAAVEGGRAFVPVIVVPEWLLWAEHPMRVAINQGSRAALELFGSALELDEATPERRAQVVALAVMLVAYEADTVTHSWRSPDPATAGYLSYAEANGYELSDVERLVCGEGDR